MAFETTAINLAPGAPHGGVFVRDRMTQTTRCVSAASDGTPGVNYAGAPSISADGRFVTFYAYASSLVPDDTNGVPDIFVNDRITGLTERLSLSSDGVQGNGPSGEWSLGGPAISADGSVVAFGSQASNLVSGDTNGAGDVFVREWQMPAVVVAGRPAGGKPGATVALSARLLRGADGAAISGETLQFFVDAAPIGSGVTGSDGTVTIPYAIPSWFTLGPHTLGLVHPQNGPYPEATSTATLAVTATSAPYTLSFSTYAAKAALGHVVTLRSLAYWRGRPAAGLPVIFLVDGLYAGTATSTATDVRLDYLLPNTLAPGLHNVTVKFLGDASTPPASRTTAAVLTVTKGSVGLSLYAAAGLAGQTVMLKSLMRNGGQPIVGRTVRFAVDGTEVGTAGSDAGGVSRAYTIPGTLAPGVHTVTVTFDGDASFYPATRTAAALTVR